MAILLSSLPPGVSPPLTEDNEHNHNGLLVIITSLGLFLVLASLGIRIFASSKRSILLRDDYVLFIVVACACAQVSVVLVQVHFGWGKSGELLRSADYFAMVKAGYAADLLYALILGLSKVCTMLFYQNLSLPRTKWMIKCILAACALWILLAMLLLAIRCSSEPWRDINQQCSGLLPRWQAISALDIILEVLILCFPVVIILNVQISLRKKIIVLIILSFRIILIPLSAIHFHYAQKQIRSSDPTLLGAYATTTAELHMSLSIVLLTVSSLKLFVAVYEDDQGFAYTEEITGSNSNSGPTAPTSWKLSRPIRDRGHCASPGSARQPILQGTSASASSSKTPCLLKRTNAIMKSVQISVTRECIELEERRASGIPAADV
ncbi:uncharacterized protein BP01DRAFT_323083 [Aspergillus saccharolyticus JOP 1030-1]|uniref:Rhodopsin domain-containing protein n=1 Tax=Aspergillus saccharolyticus JOP 1030-1 TaxID=1450539 RepID=A0A318ZID9_9EURO|nr:hypothetical protein BP01DRAFT_323083 [Aspergillus saccharolyticus JOP 1030-1]PYH43460.1 hypothetical protein BP01DRAFT_323083 [Aspergillus saccharolyticus JOP 1030-1]